MQLILEILWYLTSPFWDKSNIFHQSDWTNYTELLQIWPSMFYHSIQTVMTSIHNILPSLKATGFVLKIVWSLWDLTYFLAAMLPSQNIMWANNTIWQHTIEHRFGSTLALVMACCLMVQIDDQNQCWLITHQWHSTETNVTDNLLKTAIHKMRLQNTHIELFPHLPGANE